MTTNLRQVLHKHSDMLNPRQRKVVSAFVQESENSGYEPASGEIFGILKQMKESFETNLANSQKEEMQSQKDYEDLKAAKEAQSKESLEDTRNVLAADTKFLASLKEQCQNVDQEYEERTKTRQLEIQATTKALAFLSSDEAHDLFTRTFNFI